MKFILFILFIFEISFSQNRFQIKPKYSYLKLIGTWAFQSMETVTYSEQNDREIVLKDEQNTETLSFHRSGSLSFETLNNGSLKKGRGIWKVNDNHLIIFANEDTVDASYEIENNILEISTTEKESVNYFGYKTIVTYVK